jgi:hypothetical protein
MTPAIPTSPRARLLGMEQYNSRSFHLITEEAIEAVEAAAVATERARLRAAPIRAAISNAYYEARNRGETMEVAADMASAAVLALGQLAEPPTGDANG